ncbi:MAG TPA: hypothetical protein PK308_00575 [Phycisphaerales bacterium]|nr:hypothetical protein [Phycisphaerales bacterium]
MSQPYDGTIHSRLSALEKLFKETYSDELLEPTYMSGGPSVSMFDFQDESIGGDGMTFKIKRMKSAPTSFSRSALAEFGLADRPYLDSEYKYRFHQTDPSKNDFGRASAAVQVSWYDIKNASKQAMIDLVKENVKDFRDDMKWKKAVARNTGRSCILAYVNGTKKNNDGKYMGDCSAYTSGATSFRANIDNGTPARFRPGDLCDVVDTGGTVVADRVKVTDVSPEDPSGASVGFLVDANATITNCDGVADNYYIVISGSYNQGPWTVQDWMTPPSSGDSFIGGVDRNDAKYRLLQPMFMRKGQSAKQVSEDDLLNLGRARAYLMDKSEVSVIRASMEIVDSLRKQIPAAAFVEWPTTGANTKRWSHLGTSGLTYQSPQMGLVNFQGDPMMVSDYMDCYDLGGFREASYGAKGVQILEGDAVGMWSRMNSATPGAGKTLVYRAEGFYLFGDRCRDPIMNARVLNLTA